MKYHSCKCSKKMPFLSVLLIKFLVARRCTTWNRLNALSRKSKVKSRDARFVRPCFKIATHHRITNSCFGASFKAYALRGIFAIPR